MSKVYSIETNKDNKLNDCFSFNLQQKMEYSSAYVEVLRIFREAFELIDMTTVLRKK